MLWSTSCKAYYRTQVTHEKGKEEVGQRFTQKHSVFVFEKKNNTALLDEKAGKTWVANEEELEVANNKVTERWEDSVGRGGDGKGPHQSIFFASEK